MSEQNEHDRSTFVVTKAYRRFTEVCDACRRFRSVGLGSGPPGTGKTESARYYAQWDQVAAFLPESLITFTGRSAVDEFYPYKPFAFASAQTARHSRRGRAVFYTAPVAASPARIERQVLALFAAFSYLVEAANECHQGKEDFLVMRRSSPYIELLIVDEANRLKDAGLEQIRDLYDKGKFGLVLLGMPGLDKRMQRAPQLYSRVGFAHKMEPLSEEETRFFLDQRWSHRINASSDDFTDQEAVAAILRITRGNIRLIDRLMMQVELVLVANELSVVTKEVVETARHNLIIGFE